MNDWKPIDDIPKGVVCFVYRKGRLPLAALRCDWGEKDMLFFPNTDDPLHDATHFCLVQNEPD